MVQRDLFGKGMEALRKAYGGRASSTSLANPVPQIDDAKKLIT